MLEIKSQRTNAGNGSNLAAAGASVFHESQNIVQTNIIEKKPMVPTFVVIQIANISDCFSSVVYIFSYLFSLISIH
jgi:hypothetical protein